MAGRAFVIAVEDYPKSNGTLSTLEGTLQDAGKFAAFARDSLSVPKENIIFCSSGDSPFRTHGASLSEVRDALEDLYTKSQASGTETLLAYVSGHGMMIPGQGAAPHTDVLLLQDFRHSRRADGCLPIEELTRSLSRGLGPGNHLWFIDACRTIDPNMISANLGLNLQRSSSGSAGWFQMTSTTAGSYAPNDRVFVDSLLECLGGDCDLLSDPAQPGKQWVTYSNVARRMLEKLEKESRSLETRSLAERSDLWIRSLEKASATATIVDRNNRKAPPVELLRDYDDVIFLGETNGQLQKFIDPALELRKGRRWTNLEVFSIEDLSLAGRPGELLEDLQQERNQAEDFLTKNASRITEHLALYRYSYAGTYGSLWTAANGRRRVHVSPRILGVNIRTAPGCDFVDFPGDQHPTINQYYRLVQEILRQPDCRQIYVMGTKPPVP